MNNRYVTVVGDKFSDKKTTNSDTLNFDVSRRIGLHETVYVKFTHISDSDGETDAIIIDFKSFDQNLGQKLRGNNSWRESLSTSVGEWAFLRSGSLIVRVNDVENIELAAHELKSDVQSSDVIVRSGELTERVAYIIDKEILEKIAGAQMVELKLTGGATGASWILPATNFQLMAQAIYSSVYDADRFRKEMDSIENAIEKMNEIKWAKKKNRVGGCLMEIAAFFGVWAFISYLADAKIYPPAWVAYFLLILSVALPIAIEIKVRKRKKSIG